MCLAIPGKLLSIEGEDILQRTGKVEFGSVTKDVSLACVPEAEIGQYLLVHVGLAISVLDEDEANQVYEYLREIGELNELEDRETSQ
jgi:hydrogenase expression/formation protein HypC